MNERPHHQHIHASFIVNCFGRGGSSILWNMIGSSPDVLMPASEWHQSFYGCWSSVGRVLRKITRAHALEIPVLPRLPALIYRRALASIPATEWEQKPVADAIVLKLMDHHIIMNSAITAAFDRAQQIVLIRHPLTQCESLRRSGLNLDSATKWYNDVTRRLIRLAETKNALVYRFSDLVADPFTVRDNLYSRLGITPPHQGTFQVKRKRFGEERTPEFSAAIGNYVEVSPQNVRGIIDADVEKNSLARLTNEEKAFIWRKTSQVAAYFGYDY